MVYPLKILVLLQAIAFVHTRLFPPWNKPLGGEHLSAFGPAAAKHITAVLGFHAIAETVIAFAFSIVGLVRAKHGDSTTPFFTALIAHTWHKTAYPL